MSLPFPDIKIHLTLKKMLDFYFSPEDLESKYKCVDCDEKVDATKFYKIAEPPRLLTIQLKRFSFKRKGSKNESQVDFPLTGLILSTASSLTAEELSAIFFPLCRPG